MVWNWRLSKRISLHYFSTSTNISIYWYEQWLSLIRRDLHHLSILIKKRKIHRRRHHDQSSSSIGKRKYSDQTIFSSVVFLEQPITIDAQCQTDAQSILTKKMIWFYSISKKFRFENRNPFNRIEIFITIFSSRRCKWNIASNDRSISHKHFWVLLIYAITTNTQLCTIPYKSPSLTPTPWWVMLTNIH